MSILVLFFYCKSKIWIFFGVHSVHVILNLIYNLICQSYDDNRFSGHRQRPLRSETRTLSEVWRRTASTEVGDTLEEAQVDNKKVTSMDRDRWIYLPNHQKSTSSSYLDNITATVQSVPNSLLGDVARSSKRTKGSPEFKSTTTCRPASITREGADVYERNHPVMSVSSARFAQPHPQQPLKTRSSPMLSWLFPRSKKKSKSDTATSTGAEYEDMTRLFKDWGFQTFDSLKRELQEATETRDLALSEVGEMRSTLEDLKHKMSQLEIYSAELKKSLIRRSNNEENVNDDVMPVSDSVMVEGFLQIVSEARLSIKQFIKTLVNQTDESTVSPSCTDMDLTEKLNLLLKPYNLTMDHPQNYPSRNVLYHIEGLITKSMYQNFENCVFSSNGPPNTLSPRRARQENFSTFVSLRNLSWNEVLQKGTKYYSEELSRFCDRKMSEIVGLLDWSRPWPEKLLHSFFVSAKCVWLVHLLAFSFDPPLRILRVAENGRFDEVYMEDVLVDGRRRSKLGAGHGGPGVKITVAPGFYLRRSVIKCKVLCRYK